MSLFWNKKVGSYFFLPEGESKCSNCNKVIEIGSRMFVHRSFSKKNYQKKIYCLNCIKEHKTRVYDEFINAEVTLMPPKGSVIVPEYKPGLQSARNLSVFDVDEINKAGGEIIDKCKLSHNPNRNVMPDVLEHKEKVMARIGKLDQPASVQDFKDILGAKPAIAHKKKKRIEKK